MKLLNDQTICFLNKYGFMIYLSVDVLQLATIEEIKDSWNSKDYHKFFRYLHRLDGPAVEASNDGGDGFYWISGESSDSKEKWEEDKISYLKMKHDVEFNKRMEELIYE
jgi:hypothetical protein